MIMLVSLFKIQINNNIKYIKHSETAIDIQTRWIHLSHTLHTRNMYKQVWQNNLNVKRLLRNN